IEVVLPDPLPISYAEVQPAAVDVGLAVVLNRVGAHRSRTGAVHARHRVTVRAEQAVLAFGAALAAVVAATVDVGLGAVLHRIGAVGRHRLAPPAHTALTLAVASRAAGLPVAAARAE